MSDAYKTACMVCGFKGSQVKLLAKTRETFHVLKEEVRLVNEWAEWGKVRSNQRTWSIE